MKNTQSHIVSRILGRNFSTCWTLELLKLPSDKEQNSLKIKIELIFYNLMENIPLPGIEPGPPGWEPDILTTRP